MTKVQKSLSNFSEACKENRENMLELFIETSLLLLLNILIKRVGNRVSNLSHFLSGDNIFKFRNIKKHVFVSKDDVSIHPSVLLHLRMTF